MQINHQYTNGMFFFMQMQMGETPLEHIWFQRKVLKQVENIYFLKAEDVLDIDTSQ